MKRIRYIIFTLVVSFLILLWVRFYFLNIKAKYNLILISIDTLQADHLGCYGYHRNTSPFIDKFAAQSILFKNAYSQFNFTFCSHTAIFTGLHPIITKTYDAGFINLGFIPDQLEMLGEIMKLNNYRTAAFTDGLLVNGELGFNRGFEIYEDNIRTGSKINIKKAINFITSLKKNEQYFVFIHTYDVHSPYRPAGQNIDYHPVFAKKKYTGKLKNLIGKPSFTKYEYGAYTGRMEVPANDSEFLISHYDSCIRFVDKQIGKLIAFLKKTDALKNTIIILTSDHGEQFYPTSTIGFNYNAKNFFLHEGITSSMLKVPLIFYIPDKKNQIIETVVEAGIDILPTLVELLGLDYIPKYELSGESLLNYTKEDKRRKNYALTINPFLGQSLIVSNKQYIIPNKNSREKVYNDFVNKTYLNKEIPDEIIVVDLKKHYKKYEFEKINKSVKNIFKNKNLELQKMVRKLQIKTVGFKFIKDPKGNFISYRPASFYLGQTANSIGWSNPIHLSENNYTLSFKYGIWNETAFIVPDNTFFEIYIKELDSKRIEKIKVVQLEEKISKQEMFFYCYMAFNKKAQNVDLRKYKNKKIQIGLGIKSQSQQGLYFIWEDLSVNLLIDAEETLEYQKEKLKSLGYFH